MPSEVVTYKCDYCKTSYNEKKDAENCENRHIKVDIFNCQYPYPIYANAVSEYPETINVLFNNGKVREYGLRK